MNISLRTIMAVLLCSLAIPAAWAGGKNIVTSPNNKTQVNLTTDGGVPTLHITLNGHDTGTPVTLGLETTTMRLGSVTKVKATTATKVTDDYKMLTGKRLECHNEAYEKSFTLTDDKKQSLTVVVRAYNDGVAFRYQLDAAAINGAKLTAELTNYRLPKGLNRWMARHDVGYEQFFPLNNDGVHPEDANQTQWGYPALVQLSDDQFMLLTEADITRGHCGSHIANDKQRENYHVVLAGNDIPLTPEADGSWLSPWRLMIMGSLADVVESTLVTDVSTPCKVENTSWVRPGVASWIYWAYNHGSREKKLLFDYVDLAAAMHWPLTLIDAEWDEMTNGDKIEDVLKYAREKGIDPIIWYNSSVGWINGAPGPKFRLNKPEDRRKEYAWAQSQGVKGLKIDFFRNEEVVDMDYYIDLLEDAVPYQLMINFHGATLPRGWQRTYPHLMTCEAVYGAEWYNNNGRLTNRAACHNATLPFTRGIVGSMDYTPCTLTDSQHPHITSHAHELALPVLFESGIQHMADRPAAYLGLPQEIRDLLTALPTAWDDTKLLTGYPGHDVVIARRKGNTWWVAGINGTDAEMTLNVDLSGLKGHGDTATIICDGDGQTKMRMGKMPVKDNERLAVKCQPRGGFVIVL